MPAITADAAFVPWALDGIRQTVRAALPVGPVVRADRQQAGELALRAGVRLQRHRVVAGHLAQPRLQLADQLEVAGGLLDRCERVHRRELRPGDRLHLRGGVELHRARAQRDHRPVQGQVAVRELAQVAQHRGLGPVRVEHRVGQHLVVAQQLGGQPVLARQPVGVGLAGVGTERGPDRREVLAGRGLVRGDRHVVGVDEAQVDPSLAGRGDDGVSPARRTGQDGVEERVVHDLDAVDRRAARRRARPRRSGCAGRSPAARPGRGRRRTCRP